MAAQLATLMSCKTVQQSDASYISKADTVYVDKVHEHTVHDSIYVNTRDSIFVDRYVDDNNVHHQDKTKYVYVTKYKAKTDTVYIKKDSIVAKNDTVYIQKHETITKKPSPIKRLESFLEGFILLAVVLYIALNFGRIKDFLLKILHVLRHFK
jgi:hypothetical protein